MNARRLSFIGICLLVLPAIGWAHGGTPIGDFHQDPSQSQEWNDGGKLVRVQLKCEACHTPRTSEKTYDLNGPLSGGHGPNITQDTKTGIGSWSAGEIQSFLKIGLTPDGDSPGGEMGDALIATGKLTDKQRHAIAVYLKSLAPLPGTQAKKPAVKPGAEKTPAVSGKPATSEKPASESGDQGKATN